MTTTRLWLAAAVALVSSVVVPVHVRADEPDVRPVSAISQRLIMIQGRAAVPIADLARALGGVLEPAAEGGRYAIRSGPAGSLRFDRAGRRPAVRQPRRAAGEGPGAQAEDPPGLFIDGLPACRGIVLQGREPHVLLDELAALFGGTAVYDAARGEWGIRGATPGWALSFR